MASIFFWWLDLSSDFGGIQNKLKIFGSGRVSRLLSSANKVQPKKVHVISFNAFWKFLMLATSARDFIGVNFFAQGAFEL